MYRVFDFHVHAFPDAIVDKATENLGNFYNFVVPYSGRIGDLRSDAKKAKVDYLLLHSTATNPKQVCSVNDFVASNTGSGVFGFGSLHPDYEDIESEVSRIISLGLLGIKLHPDFQRINADDPKMFKIYSVIEGRLPVLIHAGDERYDFSSPKRIANVVKNFPNLKVIAAHLGGYARWDEALEYLVGKNLYLDTSSALWRLAKNEAANIIKLHGTEKVLFGTDYPVTNHEDELKRFFALNLTSAENEDILFNNANSLLNLKL